MAFNAGAIEATLTLNRNPFTAGLAAARSQGRGFARERFTATATVKVDQRSMIAARQQLRNFAKVVSQATAKVNVNRRDFDTLVRDLRVFAGRTYTATVRINVNRSVSQLEALVNRLNQLGRIADRNRGSFSRFGSSGASAFARLNFSVRGVLVTLPLLLPVAGTAINGIIGLVGALGSALATVGVGLGAFALVGTSVFKTINEHAKNSADAAQRSSKAFEQVGDAQRSLAQAAQSAARSNAAAARRVQDAEQSLTRAQEDAQRAQEALTRAREEAREELEDLQLALRGGALAEEQAVLDLEEAQLRYNQALEDGVTGNELQQLELNIRQAALAVDEAKERYGDLREESEEFSRTGIDGSRRVVEAQDTVNDSIQAVRDAEEDLAVARQDAADTARDAQESIAQAHRELARAQADAAVASQGQAAALTGAMASAEAALNRLKRGYEDLVTRTREPVAKAMEAGFRAITVLLSTLDPLVISFSRGLEQASRMAEQYFGSPHWKQFVDLLSTNMVPIMIKLFEIVAFGTQSVMNLVTAFMPLSTWLLDRIATGMERFANWTATLAGDAKFQGWLESVKNSLIAVGNFLKEFGEFIFNLSKALGPIGDIALQILTQIFEGLNKLPPEWLAGIAVGLTAIFAAMALGATGPIGLVIGAVIGLGAALFGLYNSNQKVKESVDSISQSLKSKFAPIWKNISDNFNNKVIPVWRELYELYRDDIGPVITKLANLFAEKLMPRLQSIADTITGKLMPAIGSFLIAIEPFVKFFVETIGVLIIAILDDLAFTFDTVLKVIADLFNIFAALFTGDWDKLWKSLKDLFQHLFIDVLKEFFGGIFRWIMDRLGEFGGDVREKWDALWKGVSDFVSGIWDGITDKWDKFIQAVGDKLRAAVDTWNQFWHNFWVGINFLWDRALEDLRKLIDGAKDRLGDAWKAVANKFRDPINWVIRVVLNRGILDSWNTVMGWIGAEKLKANPIPEIPMFKRGGVLPGYAPGNDSLLIGASPGEAILRPEVSRAVGSRWVDQINATAMRGGIGAVQKFLAFGGEGLQQFAEGGVVGGQKFARSQAGRPYGWGDVGPLSYDCSGFISAITNAVLGIYPHRRRFATGSFSASRGAGGFLPGTSSAFVIGVSPNTGSGIGHMAGNIGGLNVESRGGDGVVVGDRARGPQSGMFPWRFYLPQVGGVFQPAPTTNDGSGVSRLISWWSAIGSKVTGLFDKLLNFSGLPGMGSPIINALTEVPRRLVGRTKSMLQDRLSKVFTLGFDNGGMLPPGLTLAYNGTGKPEPVGKGVGLDRDDLERLVRAIVSEVQPVWGNLIVQTSERATAKEIIDEATFRARSARMLGVHR
jgi:hypothetical protein